VRRTRARQADVAKLANVSPAVVSVIMNDRLDSNVQVSAATRQRVWDAVQELGYMPNPIARTLAGGKNNLFGVFSFAPVFPMQQTYFYPQLVGIEEEVAAHGYNLILFTGVRTPDGQRSIYKDGVNGLQLADGVILVDVINEQQQPEVVRLSREGFPFVFVGRHHIPGVELSYVAADYAEATVDIMRRLVDLGHRHIAFLGTPNVMEWNEDRERGYRAGRQRFGLSPDDHLIIRCPPEQLTSDLLSRTLASGVTAFVADSVALAATLMRVAHTMGKVVPNDISVASLDDATITSADDEAIAAAVARDIPGFHDSGGARGFRARIGIDAAVVPLLGMTTLLIPHRQMGVAAVRLLTDILAHPDEPGPHRVTVPCPVIHGQTVAAAPRLPETAGD